MSSLTIKQKIILGVIICAMLIVIGIYGYISINEEEELDISEIINDEIMLNSQEENIDVANQNETNVTENNVNFSENTNQNSRTRN